MDIKRYLNKRLGTIAGDDKPYYELLVNAYEDYYNNRALLTADCSEITRRVATKEKNEAYRQILQLLKHFGIKATDRSKAEPTKSATEGLLE